MKTLCALAIGFALALSATVVCADTAPLDPSVILFGLKVANDGGGVFDIENDTGFTWTSLNFLLVAPSNESIFSCDGGPFFQNCSIGITGTGSASGTNMVDAFFSGLGPCGLKVNCDGLPSGDAIFVSLDPNCVNASACGSWQPNSLATVSPNPTPEPESIVLLLTGFLPLLPFRKRLFNSRSSA